MIFIILAFSSGVLISYCFVHIKTKKLRRDLDESLKRVIEYQTLLKKHSNLDEDMMFIEYVPYMRKIINQMAMHDKISEQEIIKKAVALLYTVKESRVKHGTDLVLCMGNKPVQKLSGY